MSAPIRYTTAADAIARIHPRQRIFIGSGAAEPVALVEALVQGTHLAGNEIVHLLTLGPAPYVAPELSGRFRHTAFFIGANTRGAVNDGRADFMPVFLSEIPALIRSGRVAIDVALIIALPAPAKKGSVSRIQVALEAGSGVVTSRGDVHYVVTEFGVADLWGRSVRSRAEALIGIAHPDFRADLRARAAGRRYIMPPDDARPAEGAR